MREEIEELIPEIEELRNPFKDERKGKWAEVLFSEEREEVMKVRGASLKELRKFVKKRNMQLVGKVNQMKYEISLMSNEVLKKEVLIEKLKHQISRLKFTQQK